MENVKKKMKFLPLLFAACCAFASCGGTDSGAEENGRLYISHTTLTVGVGESIQLTTTYTPVTDRAIPVDWRSADSAIATVVNGLVTGVAPGKTLVIAQTGEKSASCKIVVK